MPNLTLFSTAAIGAGIAALTAGWSQVKGLFERVAGLVIVTSTISGRASGAVAHYCDFKLKRSWTPFRCFYGYVTFVKPLKTYQTVAYEIIGSKTTMFWAGKRPVWLTYNDETWRATLVGIRGLFDTEKFILDAMDFYSAWESVELESRFRVVRLSGKSGKDLWGGMAQNGKSDSGGKTSSSEGANVPTAVAQFQNYRGRPLRWTLDDLGQDSPSGDPLARISTTSEVDDAISEIKRWFNSKDWYNERQIPWRRGLLLQGPPGTGKSSLTKALAQALEIPIYLFDISTMDNQEFHNHWQTVQANTPALALIEDIDNVFHGRENVVAEKGQGLTFDCLLNTISGVESSDGILLIVTTNNLEHIDPALGLPENGVSSRPGRIDRVVEMPALTEAGRYKMANRILAGCHPEHVEALVKLGRNDTGAQFEDRCAQAALDLYWTNTTNLPPTIHIKETANV